MYQSNEPDDMVMGAKGVLTGVEARIAILLHTSTPGNFLEDKTSEQVVGEFSIPKAVVMGASDFRGPSFPIRRLHFTSPRLR